MNVPEDQYISIGSVNTRYWQAGEGFPVVLLHGLTESIEDWLFNFTELAENHRVYALDYIGHGKTDKPLSASYRVRDMARFIKDFLDTVGVNEAHLIGHSFGGWISLYLTLDFPSYVNKLVIVDSAGLTNKSSLLMRAALMPGLGEFLGARIFDVDFEKHLERERKYWPDADWITDDFLRLRYDATRWRDIMGPTLKIIRTTNNLFGVKDSEYLPTIEGLSSIVNPLLVIWGRDDVEAPVSCTQVIAEKVPHAKIEIFDGCGHAPMIEKPQKFNELVLAFLSPDSHVP